MIDVDFAEYEGVYSPTLEFFTAAFKLAEQLDGELQLTNKGRLLIKLPESNSVQVAASITNEDFPYGYVEAGTWDTLVFGL